MEERPTANPIIPGFAPDPSVCLIGDTFFLVNSSFHIFPGIPIYASKNLISWTHIGNAINRRSQLSLSHATTALHPGDDDGQTLLATGGLYAPTIRHHKGVTYILCTNIVHSSAETPEDERNFIIHTTDIYSGYWSDPVYYAFRGIDPSIHFDDDGKVYVQGTGTSNDFQIYNMEVDLASGRMLTEPRIIWTGWRKRYTEGPHVYKRGEWYYLLCAEDGTFDYHMVTMARARSIWGPYESCPRNPVWTAHGTRNYVQHTGHADLFQDTQSRWWAVILGVRRTDNGRYILGRESFLTSVEWTEGDWPVIQPVTTEVVGTVPDGRPVNQALKGVDWVYLRDPELERYEIYPDAGRVRIRASPVDLTSPNHTVSFIGKRQRRLTGTSTVTLCLDLQDKSSVRAGLAVYKDELRFQTVSYDFTTQQVSLYAQNTTRKYVKSAKKDVHPVEDLVFRVDYSEQTYRFSFRTVSESSWISLGEVDTLEMTGLDFTGPLIGMFAVGAETMVQFTGFQLDVGEL